MRASLTAEAQRPQRERRGSLRRLCALCASAVREAYVNVVQIRLEACTPIYLKLNRSACDCVDGFVRQIAIDCGTRRHPVSRTQFGFSAQTFRHTRMGTPAIGWVL